MCDGGTWGGVEPADDEVGGADAGFTDDGAGDCIACWVVVFVKGYTVVNIRRGVVGGDEVGGGDHCYPTSDTAGFCCFIVVTGNA